MEETGTDHSFPLSFWKARGSMPNLNLAYYYVYLNKCNKNFYMVFQAFDYDLFFLISCELIILLSVVHQVEEEASDKDNKNCSNTGKQHLRIFLS